MDIDKLEPSTLNHEAREKLLKLISERMNAINHCIINRLKYSLDKAEFARNHSLSEPMDKVEDFLKDARGLIIHSLIDLESDAVSLEELVQMAKKIRESEEAL